ncbi:hypothetical protein DN444_07100 [Lactobacillus reuteri]|nr:hypothetical protein [Limosilactobacillus reuteri]
MQLITLTAPDGHREQWDINLTIHALKLLKRYLEDADGGHAINPLAKQVEAFTGTDLTRVTNCLTYVLAVKHNLFRELQLVASDTAQLPRVYIMLREMDQASPIKRNNSRRLAINRDLFASIQQVTNRDQRTIKELEALVKLFMDGELNYPSLEMASNG